MNTQGIFYINFFADKIKLDQNEADLPPEEINKTELNDDNNNQCVNEWSQEYELIYLSYILEK